MILAGLRFRGRKFSAVVPAWPQDNSRLTWLRLTGRTSIMWNSGSVGREVCPNFPGSAKS